MEIEDIVKKDIREYLSSLGLEPKRETPFGYMYLSPFRNENVPSFQVKKSKNKWTDYGNDKHGDIIDLVMELQGVDIKEAIHILSNGETVLLPEYEKPTKPPKAGIEIVSVNSIHSKSLIEYVESRGIPIDLCRRHCSQVEFRFPNGKRPGRINEAVGFMNDSGGWELRSSFWKVSNSPKNIRTIKGTENTTLVFEGFFDLLSAYVYFEREKFKSDIIVLNSLGYLSTLIPVLKDSKMNYLFVDRGKAADEKIALLRESQVPVEDCRHYFGEEAQDFNEFLCSLNGHVRVTRTEK